MPRQKGIKPVAQNRKAFHDYFVEERYECGLELFGTEVKSIRQGKGQSEGELGRCPQGRDLGRGHACQPL